MPTRRRSVTNAQMKTAATANVIGTIVAKNKCSMYLKILIPIAAEECTAKQGGDPWVSDNCSYQRITLTISPRCTLGGAPESCSREEHRCQKCLFRVRKNDCGGEKEIARCW